MTVLRYSPSRGKHSPDVWGLYEPVTGSVQYICADPVTREAALIDVVLDFDLISARTSTHSADSVLKLVAEYGLKVTWVLETHPHADHVSAAAYLKQKTGAPTAIGEKVRDIAALWSGFYHLPEAFAVDQVFDRLLAEGETVSIGALKVSVWYSPGHTLGSISYIVGDAAFIHDTQIGRAHV